MSGEDNDKCTFCRILKGELEVSMVYQDDICSAFMDKQPINKGHVLVIPNKHISSVLELDEETSCRMMQTAIKITGALKKSDIKAEGINLFFSEGEAAFQEVFHVHFHVIPRYKGDGFGLKFGNHYLYPTSRQKLDEAAESIKKNL
ncbi:MAG: HIT family protein [Spirochaetales bacterium]|nr:HIT family protein [Spirochaetales bacterium]